MSKNQFSHYIFYGGLAILYIALFTGWYLGNGDMLGEGSSRFIAIARLDGLIAGFSVLLQVFLMSRVPLIDQRFNLHEIVRLHRWNGYAVVIFLSLHILSMTIGYAGLSHMGFGAQFLQLARTFQDVFKAVVAAALIFFAVALSIGAARRRVPYEFWYFVHLTLYAAILLALFHQINTGGDLIRDDWFRYYWLGLYVFVFGIWAYFRGLRIVIYALRHNFRIDSIVQEADGIYSVYVRGNKLEKFSFEPGQYVNWRVLNLRGFWQHHPYSFSDSPGKDRLRFTVNTGDGSFTKAVPTFKPGTRLLLDGPRGSFTADRVATKRVVLIAGGIGVAPYIPLIPRLLETGRSVDLLYAAREPANKAFDSELAKQEKAGLNLQYFISSQKQRVDDSTLRAYPATDTTFFLCGPPPMVEALRTTLNQMKVPAERVITERFSV